MGEYPRSFGKYELLERISVGGMAEVYKARYSGEQGFQKILAIKKILPTLTDDAEFVRMFIDEAKIAGQLSHANICQIYELGRIQGAHFIAMEFVWGKDLLQIQGRFRRMGQVMPAGQAAFIVSKLCEGLDYAHKKRDPHGRPMNIVHRDISPQNILVSYEGEVKLIDFGIAKARDRSAKTAAGVLKGKFGYMSPEQVRGLPLDRRSDIFSLGIILYELVTGTSLFDGETDFVVLEKVRNVQVIPPSQVNPSVPRELESIIMRALQPDPDDRFQWASEMNQAIQAFVMRQQPVYNARKLAQWMQKTFAAEIRKERAALERHFRPARSSRPPIPPPAADPALSQELDELEEDLEGATVLEESSPFAPLQPIVDEPADVVGEFDDDEATEIRPGAAEKPRDDLTGQATVMLDDDDPEAVAMAQKIQDLAAQSEGAPEVASAPSALAPVSPRDLAASMGQPQAPQAFDLTSPVQPAHLGRKDGFGPAGAVSGPVTPSSSARTGGVTAAHRRGMSPAVAVVLSLAVGLVAFVGGAWLMKTRSKSRVSASPVAMQGSLVLIVPTVGAKVSVDEKPVSRRPDGVVLVENLGPGAHKVNVTAPGHRGLSTQVEVSAGHVSVMTLALEPVSKPGKLVVSLVPRHPKGYVLIDGKRYGMDVLSKPVPLSLEKPVSLEIFALGYEPVKRRFPPVKDKTIPLKLKLVKDSSPMIQVLSEPSGATVFLDGKESCDTPCRLVRLSAKNKRYELILFKEGYGKAKRYVTLTKRKKKAQLVFSLHKEEVDVEEDVRPGPNSLSDARPARSRAGARTRASRPSRTRGRPVHRARPARHGDSGASDLEGLLKEPSDAVSRPRSRADGGCDRRCPSKTKGCLWANASPRARVFVDGRNTGRNTPISGRRALLLRPGRHRVTFMTSAGKRFTYGVTIRRCHVTKLIRSLKK